MFSTDETDGGRGKMPRKVSVDKTIVELDGDEMAHLLFKEVKNEVRIAGFERGSLL